MASHKHCSSLSASAEMACSRLILRVVGIFDFASSGRSPGVGAKEHRIRAAYLSAVVKMA